MFVDAVVLRQALVDKRVIRVDQIGDRPVFMDNAADEQLHFLRHRAAQIVVEIGELGGHRNLRLQGAQSEPLAGQVVDERFRFRIGQHALHFAFQHGGLVQLVLRGQREERSSGMLLHRKKERRDASARSLIRYGCPDFTVAGSASLRK